MHTFRMSRRSALRAGGVAAGAMLAPVHSLGPCPRQRDDHLLESRDVFHRRPNDKTRPKKIFISFRRSIGFRKQTRESP